jgi:hypothetical protein
LLRIDLLSLCGDVEANPGPFTFLSLNVNSIRSLLKRELFSSYLRSLPNLPDVLLLQETKLDDDVLDSELFLTNYAVFRRDRNEYGGGILVAVLKAHVVLDVVSHTSSEILVVSLRYGKYAFFFVNVYAPSSADVVTLCALAALLPAFARKLSRTTFLIVAGDFNTSDLTPETLAASAYCPRTESLFSLCADNAIFNVVDYPTRALAILDLVFCSAIELATSECVDGISDHDGNLVSLDLPSPPVLDRSFFRNFRKANWDLATPVLEVFLRDFHALFLSRTIDQNYVAIKTVCSDVLAACVPLEQRCSVGPPRFICREIAYKMRLHRALKSSTSPSCVSGVMHPCCDRSSEDCLLERFREQRRKVKRLLREHARAMHARAAQNISSTPKKFWAYINRFRKRSGMFPALKHRGLSITDSLEKANIFAEVFNDSFQDEPPAELFSFQCVKLTPDMEDVIFSVAGVQTLLKELRTDKSIGPDLICSNVLKRFHVALASPVTRLFQQSFDSGKVPTDWTQAFVHPIPKK